MLVKTDSPARLPNVLVWRRLKSFCYVPSTIYAPFYAAPRHRVVGRVHGLLEGHSPPTVCNVVIVALVVVLLCLSGPSAVFWLIIFVVINALKCVLRAWAPSYVGDEVLKVVPALTHGYAATTVSFVSSHGRVIASLQHTSPTDVFRVTVAAMLEVPFGRLFPSEASARLCGPVPKREPVGQRRAPAIAHAVPASVPVAIAWSLRDDDKPTEPHAGHIFEAFWLSHYNRSPTSQPIHSNMNQKVKG